MLISCSRTNNFTIIEASYEAIASEESALNNFAITLSKAVCSHQEVREFLRSEALKRFDKDYDVLYQLVKD